MTIKASGSISMSEINAEFALGTSLSSYRGATWYTDAGATSSFPVVGQISMYDFYSKRKTSPWNGATSLDIAVVAGGGGGQQLSFFGSFNASGAPGGGGGQLRTFAGYYIAKGETLTVTVGAGGPSVPTAAPGVSPTRGGDSSVSGGTGGTITATGGGPGQNGNGGSSYAANSSTLYSATTSLRGGHGTGGSPTSGFAGIGATATLGGISYNVGGGGAGSSDGSRNIGKYWAPYPGYGGGACAFTSGTNGYPGDAGTGGGGGGFGVTTGSQYSYFNLYSGSGGSGKVIITYPATKDAAITTGSPTYIVSGGYRTYIFTQSGTIKW